MCPSADAENPSLSPDGSTIVYASFNEQKRGIWTIRPDGTNAKLLAPGLNILPEISPDGAWVSFSSQGPTPDIGVVRLADGAPIFRIQNVLPPDVELHSFGLAPNMRFAVVAVRRPAANLLEIDGLPPDVAPAPPRRL